MAVAIELRSELHPGMVTMIDDEDLPLVEPYSWCVNSKGYAVARIDGKVRYLHRVLLPGVALVDHVNGDKLDNRKVNLRPATVTQNAANSAKRSGTSSQYKGVSWSASAGRWVAQIQAAGVKRNLGRFTDEAEAAAAYDQAAVEAFGPFALTNAMLGLAS